MNNLKIAVSSSGRLSQTKMERAILGEIHDQFVNGNSRLADNATVADKMPMSDGVKIVNVCRGVGRGGGIPFTEIPPVSETAEPTSSEKTEIDFSGKDFEETQKMLNQTAKITSLKYDIRRATDERMRVIGETFKHTDGGSESDEYGSPDAVIQYHMDKWDDYGKLERYLKGSLKDERVATRINEFFTHPVTGEVLEMVKNPNVKNEINELDFKRGLILYFKRNDEYMAAIDKEMKKLNQAQAELDRGISEALNPLKDNILAYAEYLIAHNQPNESDDSETAKRKGMNLKKAHAIRCAYTLENMIELVESHPGIISNAKKDFRSENMIRQTGDRYMKKLRTARINFNLAPLLSDDIHDSLEYRVLPQGDYPAGFENFTVFFIIRSLAVTLPAKEEVTFHAAVYTAFTQLINGEMDEDVADMVKRSIVKFLSYFA